MMVVSAFACLTQYYNQSIVEPGKLLLSVNVSVCLCVCVCVCVVSYQPLAVLLFPFFLFFKVGSHQINEKLCRHKDGLRIK